MGKNPADQFYWGDWLNDVELQAASALTRGIWINALCRMWYAKNRGEILGDKLSLSQTCNCTEAEFDVFLSEARVLGFCEVFVRPHTNLQNSNNILTIQNRRMYKAEKKRKADRLRAQKSYYKKKSHADSKKTSRPLSSSSSSTSKKNARTRASQKTYQKGNLDLNGDLPEAPLCHYCKKVRTPMTDSDGHPKCPECW